MPQRENYYYTPDLLPPADKYFVDRTAVRAVLPKKQINIGRARLSLLRSLPTRANINKPPAKTILRHQKIIS